MQQDINKESLHNLAKQAKTRLRNSYAKGGEMGFCDREEAYRTHNEAYEQTVYSKVVSIIESKKIVTNPLSFLIDKEKFASSNEGMRQKMVLDASSLYLKLRARYFALEKQRSEERSSAEISHNDNIINQSAMSTEENGLNDAVKKSSNIIQFSSLKTN